MTGEAAPTFRDFDGDLTRRNRVLLLGLVTAAAFAFVPSRPAFPQSGPSSAPATPSVAASASFPSPTQSAHWRDLFEESVRAADRGRYAEAVRLGEQMLALAEVQLRRDDPEMAVPLAMLGNFHWLHGRYARSEPLLRRALELNERAYGPADIRTLLSLMGLALSFMAQDRYAEAEPLLLRGAEPLPNVAPGDQTMSLEFIEALADLYRIQNRLAEAETLLVGALEMSRFRYGENDGWQAPILYRLALLRDRQGNQAEAQRLYLRTLRHYEAAQGPEDGLTLNVIATLGNFLASNGRLDDAEPLLVRALRGVDQQLGPEHPNTLSARWNLGALRARQGRSADADTLLREAFADSDRILGSRHSSTISIGAALVRLRLSAPAVGDSALHISRQIVAAQRERLAILASDSFGEAEREREASQSSLDFSLLADAAWEAAAVGKISFGDVNEEAFMALQDMLGGSASRALVRMAVRNLADATGGGLGDLARERDSLGDEWRANNANYSAALASRDEEAAERRAGLGSERQRIEARITQIDSTLRRDFPEYFALIRPESLDVATAQAMLGPQEAMLLVVPTQFGTHVMALTATRIEWSRSPWNRERVDAAVRRLLWDVGGNVDVSREQAESWHREAGPGFPFDRRTAFNLYQQIVAPIAESLEDKRHVFIVAGGALASLPFGMLVVDEPRGSDADPDELRDTSWFADAHALTQIPSIQALQFLRRFARRETRAGAGNAFIGFGDPALQGPSADRSRRRGARGSSLHTMFERGRTRSGGPRISLRQLRLLTRLPGTAVELENLRLAFGAGEDSLFLRERATEAAVRSTDLSNANILVFATHGLLGGELRDMIEPGLVLTPPQVADEHEDGFLTGSEVAALHLNADWVILSACNTAAGDGSEGAPGLSGLARAFFYAGARNLLASHWPVGDDVTARLTVRTIQILNERSDVSRAEALQLAMREIRNDAAGDGPNDSWAHPSAWAPFTLIGDGATR